MAWSEGDGSDQRHGAAALMSTYNTAKYISSNNYSCVHTCNWARVGGLNPGCSSVEPSSDDVARTCDRAIFKASIHSTCTLDSKYIRLFSLYVQLETFSILVWVYSSGLCAAAPFEALSRPCCSPSSDSQAQFCIISLKTLV